MNAELFHDALNLLPGDLITATDRLRSRPRKQKQHWLRHAAMAACFTLILCGSLLLFPFFFGTGGSSEAAMDGYMGQAENFSRDDAMAEAPMEQAPAADAPGEAIAPAPTYAAAAGKTDTCLSEETGPWRNALTQYVQTPWREEAPCIDRAYPGTRLIRSRQELEAYCEDNRDFYDLESFREGCRVYDDAFFTENDLLLVEVEEVYATIHHEVLSLTEQNDGTWVLTILCRDANMDAAETPIPMRILMDLRKDALRPEDTVAVEITQ